MTVQIPPSVIEGRSFPRHGYLSPLDPHPGELRSPTVLRGVVVTDPRFVAEIAARCAYYARPWWSRWLLRRPPSDVVLRVQAGGQR